MFETQFGKVLLGDCDGSGRHYLRRSSNDPNECNPRILTAFCPFMIGPSSTLLFYHIMISFLLIPQWHVNCQHKILRRNNRQRAVIACLSIEIRAVTKSVWKTVSLEFTFALDEYYVDTIQHHDDGGCWVKALIVFRNGKTWVSFIFNQGTKIKAFVACFRIDLRIIQFLIHVKVLWPRVRDEKEIFTCCNIGRKNQDLMFPLGFANALLIIWHSLSHWHELLNSVERDWKISMHSTDAPTFIYLA